MKARELAVGGAWELVPPVFPDERGLFCPVYEDGVLDVPFRVRRSALSVNRAGAARGIHYSPGGDGPAKIVHCVAGRVLDIVVDVRVGSPAFGRWDSVLLDSDRPRAVYLPAGLGHAFVALTGGTVLSYLLTTTYRPEDERAVALLDPALGLPLPQARELVMSAADRAAPTLADALDRGLLPRYRTASTKEDET
ncbi:dTDP-4-dehydrorhamnose 3,5-epimerase family protein [Couchioplanes caeruleus]|uniref:NDP-4-keto-6-deoxyhexose 3, 5 epimerase n=2 Tax=Couchioplanes caeruleus TaxID=56438 RepID=A0A1K0FSK6_9ACTN|nr:dTDP-4-dehydrorhamnose 3,5-epimerase [Couchioplanes caeruleus]OJF15656.1 NDP-4-keto-6-deoxyhexose 3, 5 epimerase [Couchioplanes caeruleus subsp. caeruleus]ROP33839.1 dTDP-4-dehydrorhamnose 3,5-epimerase/epimerase EvaD [Couchioplanes caeruleus]